MLMMPARSSPNTTRRCTVDVELYKCTIARLAPRSDSYVRSICSGRACVSTWMTTSSGMRLRSISSRTKSKSVCDAAGKPTSISLKPVRTSRSNMRRLRAASIGSISAWLPSRRSTLHHSGGAVITLSGQVRALRSIGANGRYFCVGSCNMVGIPVRGSRGGAGTATAANSSGFFAPVPGERSVGLRLSDAGAGAYAAAHCLGGAARTVADSYAWAESSSRPQRKARE